MSNQERPYIPLTFGRIPGWLLAFGVAIVATCLAIIAVTSVYSQARNHRAEEYRACLSQAKSTTQVIDAFGKLRDANLTILDVTSSSVANQPTTPAGRAIVAAVQKEVAAYNQLLFLAAQGQKVDCSTLR